VAVLHNLKRPHLLPRSRKYDCRLKNPWMSKRRSRKNQMWKTMSSPHCLRPTHLVLLVILSMLHAVP
jgi:hypothetical protein